MPPSPWPTGLLRALKQGQLVPFAGAGVSMAVRTRTTEGERPLFPSWRELLLQSSQVLVESDPQKAAEGELIKAMLAVHPPRLLMAAEEAKNALGPTWLTFLKSVFNPPRNRAVPDSLALAEAVWKVASNLVITTNYDRILRWACPNVEDLSVALVDSSVVQNSILRNDSSTPILWHLHGAIDALDKIVLTPASYRELYSAEPRDAPYAAALQALRSCLAARTLVFIGFSMDDEYVSAQIEWLHQVFHGAMGPHYMLVRESELMEYRARLAKLPIQFVPFSNFGEPLVAALNDLARAREQPEELTSVWSEAHPELLHLDRSRRIACLLSGDLTYTIDIQYAFRTRLLAALAPDSPRSFEFVTRVGPRRAPGEQGDADAQWDEIREYFRNRSRGREFDYYVGIGTQASQLLRDMLGEGLRRNGRERLLFLGVTDPVAAGLINATAPRQEPYNIAGVGYGKAPEHLAAKVDQLFPDLPLIFVYNTLIPQDVVIGDRLRQTRLHTSGRLHIAPLDHYPGPSDLPDHEAIYFSWYTFEAMLESGMSLEVFANRRIVATTVQNVREQQLAIAAVTVNDLEIGELGASLLLEHELRRTPLGDMDVPTLQYRYWINRTTCAQLGVRLSEQVLEGASGLF